MKNFRLLGLDAAPFAHLFDFDDEALAQFGIRRVRADVMPGFPCRVSLEDAPVGAELLLLSYEHQPARSPYRSTGPIYVGRDASRKVLASGEVPVYVTTRLISLRAYDRNDMMIVGDVAEGSAVRSQLVSYFARPDIEYVHLHNARRGCYSCVAIREDDGSEKRGIDGIG